MPDQLPRLLVTGASGFVGRRLLELGRPHYRIEAVDLRSQGESGAPRHRNIRWHQMDLANPEAVAGLASRLAEDGGLDACVHLAAYYDFTGEDHPEYTRTNVGGLRNLLEACAGLGLERFVYASSLAACRFPPPGGALDETSEPDGEHPYAVSKRRGEALLAEYGDRVPSCIVRFAALFSDWCEYPPLFVFLDTWLSKRWNARILGGRGRSAVPYLHVRDAAFFLLRVLEKRNELEPREVLLASPDGAVTHQELYEAATDYFYGAVPRPLHMPRPLAAAGMWMRDLVGRALGQRPFERPWMARYIDAQLTADAGHTRLRLGWQPRGRLEVIHRLPFLIENLRSEPVEWLRRNREMEARELRPNLRIYSLLDAHEAEISAAFTEALTGPRGQEHLPHYHRVPQREHQWHHRLILRNLMNAVRTREKGVFMAYCRDLAEHRFGQGYSLEELRYALTTLDRICIEQLATDPTARELTLKDLHDYVSMTIQFGLDRMEEVFETLESDPEARNARSGVAVHHPAPGGGDAPPPTATGEPGGPAPPAY